MTLDISFQPLPVLIDGHDSQGNLVLADNQLAAVIVRLACVQSELARPGGQISQWQPACP